MVKMAYRKKAKIYHPDVNNNPKATEYFTVVNAAYETLSDPLKKSRYDRELRKLYQLARKVNSANFDKEGRGKDSIDSEFRTKGQNQLIYNMLFASGMGLGILLISISVYHGFIRHEFSPVPVILLFPGLIILRDGWLGLTWRGGMISLRVLRWINQRLGIEEEVKG